DTFSQRLSGGPYRRVSARRERATQRAHGEEGRRYLEALDCEFQEWLDGVLGNRGQADSLDFDVLEAARQSPKLRKLVQQELPKAINNCNQVHRLVAIAEGAAKIENIASRAECYRARHRAWRLSCAAMNMLQAYPGLSEDSVLIQNLAVIRSRI